MKWQRNSFPCNLLILFLWLGSAQYASAQLLSKGALDSAIVYTSLEEALENPDSVYVLRLRRNKLETLPPEIFKLKNLNRLELQRNRFTVFPSGLSAFAYLQEIDFTRNEIDTIPPEIGQCKELRYINLGHNNLVILPTELGQLQHLTHLNLWGNLLEDIPESLVNCKKLQVIDLRVINLSKEQQEVLRQLFPEVTLHMESPCNCY